MLYDNDIEHLRSFFGAYRTMKIRPLRPIADVTPELEEKCKGHDVKVSSDDEWISLLVNEDDIKILDVLEIVQRNHTIKDMKLEEISTEEVIKKIYEGGV
ncbi:MAG: hypothetical protein MR799_09100 [Lachnospiraceae bacterium]|nr:hypothetical protein [Lachnospiraceae bacterium]